MDELLRKHIAPIMEKIENELSIAFNEYTISRNLNLKKTHITEVIKTHLIHPTMDIMKRGGKRLRPLLLILLTRIFKGDEEASYLFSPVIEGIHTASLIHDDIEDSSPTRRSFPSAHIKYGIDTALNSGASLYFFSLNLINKQKKEVQPALYKSSITALQKLHVGQAMDIKYHNNYSLNFDFSMYESLASLKTGTLFALLSEISLIFSKKKNNESVEINIFNELGIAFQMIDDLKNISTGNKGKERGDDVVEGKWSFPIVLYLDKKPKDKEKILTFFGGAKKEGITSCYVKECCKILADSGVIEEGALLAKKRIDLSLENLYKLHGSSLELDIINGVFQFLQY